MPSPPASFFGDGFEMPGYNIRNSIANKVVAKKIAKGYTLSEEKCNLCEMNLMTLNGNSECKVCPAIKKWVQRKNEQQGAAALPAIKKWVEGKNERDEAAAASERIEEPISEAREAEETVGQGADEVRDAAPAAPSVDVDAAEQEPEEGRDAAPVDSFGMDELSPPSQEVEAVGSDEKSDFEPPLINHSESAHSAEVGASASGGSEEEEEEEEDDDDDRYLSKSCSVESDDSEDTAAIRERARQIIMKARAGGDGLSWESNDSDEDSDDDDSSADGSNFQERTGEVIDDAPTNAQEEDGLDFPPHMISPRMDDVDNQLSSSFGGGAESYESVEEINTKEQVSACLGSCDSDKFSSTEENCVEETSVEETSINEEASSPKSSNGAHEAATIKQVKEQEDDVIEEQEDDAIEEAMQRSEFESLGISTSASNVQELQKEEKSGAPEDVVRDGALDDSQAQDVVQDVEGVEGVEVEVGLEQSQDETNPVSPGKNSYVAAPDTDRLESVALEAPKDSSIAAPESGRIAVETPEFNNGFTPQQQDVTASDALPPTNAHAPSRGLLANIACKFDDAVTDAFGKVQKLVNCTTDNEDTSCQATGGLAEAFEAEQNELRANSSHPGHFQCDGYAVPTHAGQVHYDAAVPGPSNYDAQMMLLASRAWPQQMMVPTYPEHHANSFANHATPHNGVGFVSSQGSFAHHGPPRPESVTNRAFNGVPPSPNPNYVASSFDMNSAAPGHPYMMETNHHLNIATQSRQPFISQTPLGSFNNINRGTNPLSDVTAAHYGPAAGQAKSTSRPPNMPRPNQTVPSKPPLPGIASQTYRPQAECAPVQQGVIPSPHVHNQMMIQNTIAPVQVPMMHGIPKQTVMQQASATPNQAQMMHNVQNLMTQVQLGPNRNQMMQLPPRGPWEQGDYAKENESRADNVSIQLREAKDRVEDAKRFIMSRSNRNMSMPPMPPPMSNNMPPRAQFLTTPNSQGFIKPQMNPENFRPQMSMPSTPGTAQQAGTPQVMRQMGSLMSPGTSPTEASKYGDDAPLMIVSPTQMRSMASPVSATGENHNNDETHATTVQDNPVEDDTPVEGSPAQMSNSPLSPHDGFPAPEMPGRYFFA